MKLGGGTDSSVITPKYKYTDVITFDENFTQNSDLSEIMQSCKAVLLFDVKFLKDLYIQRSSSILDDVLQFERTILVQADQI